VSNKFLTPLVLDNMLYNILYRYMVKTYLYIPEKLNEKITQTARKQSKSKAEIIRLAIKYGLEKEEKNEAAGIEALIKIAELGKKYKLRGPKNSSERIDELLWGIKPR